MKLVDNVFNYFLACALLEGCSIFLLLSCRLKVTNAPTSSADGLCSMVDEAFLQTSEQGLL